MHVHKTNDEHKRVGKDSHSFNHTSVLGFAGLASLPPDNKFNSGLHMKIEGGNLRSVSRDRLQQMKISHLI